MNNNAIELERFSKVLTPTIPLSRERRQKITWKFFDHVQQTSIRCIKQTSSAPKAPTVRDTNKCTQGTGWRCGAESPPPPGHKIQCPQNQRNAGYIRIWTILQRFAGQRYSHAPSPRQPKPSKKTNKDTTTMPLYNTKV